MDYVKYAKLESKGKLLLFIYVICYNWTQNKPSFLSQRLICAITGMAPSTYHQYQKYLANLGWIVVKSRGRDATSLVWVQVGQDDPDYDSKSWARWHPYNRKKEDISLEEMKSFDPFGRDGNDDFEELDLETPLEVLMAASESERFWDDFENPNSSMAE